MDRIYFSTRQFPVSSQQKDWLEACAASGPRKVELIWKAPEEMTAEDYASAVATLNFFPPDQLKNAAGLEWVQLASAGADLFTRPGVLGESVVLTNSSGAFSLSVGEHMIAQTFDLVRHFGEYRVNQTRHVWENRGNILAVEGAAIAVLGLGDIGGFYARKMAALGAHVIGVRRHEGEKPDYLEEQVTIDHLDDVLPRADIVAMVLPGGEATAHIIGERELNLMKKGSYILNVGRGNAIDPEALKKALDSGQIRGAALDVTEPEPLKKEDPLWDYDNVLITPHIAGWWFLQETFDRVVRICGENLEHFVKGEPLTHVVSKKLGY